jgi:excinuclease UvrABC nuclease subunit
MKHFQSLERIKKVNIKEIAEVKGIGLEYAKKIKGNIAG